MCDAKSIIKSQKNACRFVHDWLKHGEKRMLLIKGLPGIGKTTFVKEFVPHIGYVLNDYQLLLKDTTSLDCIKSNCLSFKEDGSLTHSTPVIFIDNIDVVSKVNVKFLNDFMKLLKGDKKICAEQTRIIGICSLEYNQKLNELSKHCDTYYMEPLPAIKLATICKSIIQSRNVKQISKKVIDQIIEQSCGNISYIENQLGFYLLNQKYSRECIQKTDKYKPLYDTVNDILYGDNSYETLSMTYESDSAMFPHMVSENYVNACARQSSSATELWEIADAVSYGDVVYKTSISSNSNLHSMFSVTCPCRMMKIHREYKKDIVNKRDKISFPFNIISCASRSLFEKSKLQFRLALQLKGFYCDIDVIYAFRNICMSLAEKYKNTSDIEYINSIAGILKRYDLSYDIFAGILKFKIMDKRDYKKLFSQKIQTHIKKKICI